MGLTTILSIFILQLGVSDKLPRTSDVVPLLGASGALEKGERSFLQQSSTHAWLAFCLVRSLSPLW